MITWVHPVSAWFVFSLSDVSESAFLIMFHLGLTHCDGIKDALAVEGLVCGLQLIGLPLLQCGVQNLTWQPDWAVSWWLTWEQRQKNKTMSHNNQTRSWKMNPFTAIAADSSNQLTIQWQLFKPHSNQTVVTLRDQSNFSCQKQFMDCLNWTAWEQTERQTAETSSKAGVGLC